MNADHNATVDPQQSEASPPDPKPKMFRRTRKVARFVLAVDAWKRQWQILNGRLRFPLLRRVLGQEIERRSQHVLVADLDQQTLEKSKVSHGMMILLMTPCLLWALITISRGLAALIKYDIFFNSWLISGIPFAIFAGAKLVVSYLSYKIISEELDRRADLAIPRSK